MSKIMNRVFTIADYEEEEIWLREQHKKGWKFVKMVPPCFYHFEECEPEDVVYRLDFKNHSEDSEYFQMFSDYGWEYAGKCIGWFYFRKPASEMETEDDFEIFSDNESRLGLVEKILKQRLFPILLIFLCCVIPQLLRSADSSFAIGRRILYGILFVLYTYIILHCGYKLMKLKAKYNL